MDLIRFKGIIISIDSLKYFSLETNSIIQGGSDLFQETLPACDNNQINVKSLYKRGPLNASYQISQLKVCLLHTFYIGVDN